MFIQEIETGKLLFFDEIIDILKDKPSIELLLNKLDVKVDKDIKDVLYYLVYDNPPIWEEVLKEYGYISYWI